MREFKFRYIFEDIKEDVRTLVTQIWNLNDIEINDIVYDTEVLIAINQYTGLKDAINKNEIYEHDIINLLGVGFLKVEWDYKHTGWICLDNHYKKRNLADVLLNGGIRVGNIYENPELLNKI